MRFHGGDDVEGAIREWQCGDGTLLDLDSSGLDVLALMCSAFVSRETATLAGE